MDITVTPKALARIQYLITLPENLNMFLRISVDGGGCAGFKYSYEFVQESKEDDFMIELGNTRIVIDPLSRPYLSEVMLDFIEELGKSHFEIKNPKAMSKCGCGNSFSV